MPYMITPRAASFIKISLKEVLLNKLIKKPSEKRAGDSAKSKD